MQCNERIFYRKELGAIFSAMGQNVTDISHNEHSEQVRHDNVRFIRH